MQIRLNFYQRVFFYFLVLFSAFTLAVLLYQYYSEKKYREEALSQNLDQSSEWIAKYLSQEDNVHQGFQSIVSLLPDSLRLTILDRKGKVLFDNLSNADSMENHLDRPEVRKAQTNQTGNYIRTSQTTHIPYYYYARKYPNFYIRVALPYNTKTERNLYGDRHFLWFTGGIFIVSLLLLFFLSRRLGQSIQGLRGFIQNVSKGDESFDNINFPDTELGEIGKQIIETYKVLAEKQARLLKHDMTGNIAHELRTPVSSIGGYIETLLLQKDLDPQIRQAFLERASAQVQRLSSLIGDIALITKMEEAPERFQLEKISVSEVFDEVCDDLESDIDKHRDLIENRLDLDLCIDGNRVLLYALFRNLIENSVKYAGDEVQIGLESYLEDENFYHLHYWDTGVGIDPLHLSRIFERFYRVSEGRTRDDGGSGLGLSIAKNSVVFHGGDIQAKHLPGGGVSFLFSLRKRR